MNKEELYRNFAENIETERIKLGYSQKKMADALDMSLSTYKSMIRGDMVNISLYTMYLAYHLTGLIASEFTGENMPEIDLLVSYRMLPEHRKKALRTILEIERELSLADNQYIASHGSETVLTSCYIPTGNMEDGMIFDSANVESIDVTKYVHVCPGSIDCAIKIMSNHLHPVYHMGDILLINQSAPRDGDTGIFINKQTHRVYIRRFRQTDPCELIPVSDYGQTIYVDSHSLSSMNQWIKLGKVLMRI